MNILRHYHDNESVKCKSKSSGRPGIVSKKNRRLLVKICKLDRNNALSAITTQWDAEIGKTLSRECYSELNRTLVGPKGFDLLQRLRLKLQLHVAECKVANGEKWYSLSFVSVPTELESKVAFDIVQDLRKSFWHFADTEPSLSVSSILPVSSLNESQKRTLDQFTLTMKELIGTSLGRTHLISHEIELTPGIQHISNTKQRYKEGASTQTSTPDMILAAESATRKRHPAKPSDGYYWKTKSAIEKVKLKQLRDNTNAEQGRLNELKGE
ncbi:hypothetical protein Trydic_g7157 [Trypoxylus dichotomus]